MGATRSTEEFATVLEPSLNPLSTIKFLDRDAIARILVESSPMLVEASSHFIDTSRDLSMVKSELILSYSPIVRSQLYMRMHDVYDIFQVLLS